MLGRHTPSHQRGQGRGKAKDLIRALQSLFDIISEANISEANRLSPVEDHSEAITLRSGILERIDNQLREGEGREDFVSFAVEVEIARRQSDTDTEKQARKE
jgi:hypothetical protein